MDALVLPFLLAILAELGSALQVLALALKARFDRAGLILAGLALAGLATAGGAAVAGALVGSAMPPRARQMLLGLALLLIAAARVRPPGRADHARDWHRLGAFGASLVAGTILLFGGEVQLGVAALAAAGRSPWLVAPAAAAGIAVACLPPLVRGAAAVRTLSGPVVRWTVAGVAGLIGTVLVLGALQLI